MTRALLSIGRGVSEREVAWVRERCERAGLALEGSPRDLVLVVGGDGALLHAWHALELPDVPFLGLNVGHLGFLMGANKRTLTQDLNNLVTGCYTIDDLQLLEVTMVDQEGDVSTALAINDVVLKVTNGSQGAVFTSGRFKVSINDYYLETVLGDGLIVSTPVGSTAYNRSAGGAILSPQLKAYQLTELAGTNNNVWRSFDRPVVFAENDVLTLVCEHDSIVGVDGIIPTGRNIKRVTVRLSTQHHLRLVNTSTDIFFWRKLKHGFINQEVAD